MHSSSNSSNNNGNNNIMDALQRSFLQGRFLRLAAAAAAQASHVTARTNARARTFALEILAATFFVSFSLLSFPFHNFAASWQELDASQAPSQSCCCWLPRNFFLSFSAFLLSFHLSNAGVDVPCRQPPTPAPPNQTKRRLIFSFFFFPKVEKRVGESS